MPFGGPIAGEQLATPGPNAADCVKEDLDVQYSPSQWCRRLDPHAVLVDFIESSDRESEKCRSRAELRADLNVKYGSNDRQKCDLYYPGNHEKDDPVLLFLHGGYWQEESVSKENNALVVPPLIKHGVVVCVMEYTLAPKCLVADIVAEIEQGVMFAARRFPDTRGLYLAGHSAGGHLSAMMLSVDWSCRLQERANVIKGICLMSGLYDLRPLVETEINDPLSLTLSSASAVSPALLVDAIPQTNIGIKVHLPVAEFDPPAFQRQAKDYCELLTARGMDAVTMVVPGRDHFDEITEMHQEESFLQQVLLGIMNLKSPHSSQL
ncbi:kynurenine formamidase-like [Diadema setosum]|uniref:kynurenine formamidase-like n=1 Tax=Diadema setosum TaxID=31175 RepID=UPI003B3BE974